VSNGIKTNRKKSKRYRTSIKDLKTTGFPIPAHAGKRFAIIGWHVLINETPRKFCNIKKKNSPKANNLLHPT
jgi:hypothetical protein